MKKASLLTTTAIGLIMMAQSCLPYPQTKQEYMNVYNDYAWQKARYFKYQDLTDANNDDFSDWINNKSAQMKEMLTEYTNKFGTDMAADYEKLYSEKLVDPGFSNVAPNPLRVSPLELSGEFSNEIDSAKVHEIITKAKKYHRIMDSLSKEQTRLMRDISILTNEISANENQFVKASKTAHYADYSKLYHDFTKITNPLRDKKDKYTETLLRDAYTIQDSLRKEYKKEIGYPMPEDWGLPKNPTNFVKFATSQKLQGNIEKGQLKTKGL